jgi:hypothetical protein
MQQNLRLHSRLTALLFVLFRFTKDKVASQMGPLALMETNSPPPPPGIPNTMRCIFGGNTPADIPMQHLRQTLRTDGPCIALLSEAATSDTSTDASEMAPSEEAIVMAAPPPSDGSNIPHITF